MLMRANISFTLFVIKAGSLYSSSVYNKYDKWFSSWHVFQIITDLFFALNGETKQ